MTDTNQCSDTTIGCTGTYLIDLFTWLWNMGYASDPAHSPVKVMWFTGADFRQPGPTVGPTTPTPTPEPFNLGIYDSAGNEKQFPVGGTTPTPNPTAQAFYCRWAPEAAAAIATTLPNSDPPNTRGKITDYYNVFDKKRNSISRDYRQLRLYPCYTAALAR